MTTINDYYFKVIKENTKEAKGIIARYDNAVNDYRYTYRDIWEAYDRPSIYKVRAWEHCERMCRDLNGYNLMITGRNSCTFTVMFEYPNPETGELMIAYITKDYNRTTAYTEA